MEAKELRIGNIVTDGVISPIIIEEVSTKGIKGRYIQESENDGLRAFTYDQIAAIPITEGWLKGFGFSQNKNSGQFYSKIQSGFKIFMSWWDCAEIEIDVNDEWLKLKCEYIHQLQNLYFALTGEEL